MIEYEASPQKVGVSSDNAVETPIPRKLTGNEMALLFLLLPANGPKRTSGVQYMALFVALW